MGALQQCICACVNVNVRTKSRKTERERERASERDPGLCSSPAHYIQLDSTAHPQNASPLNRHTHNRTLSHTSIAFSSYLPSNTRFTAAASPCIWDIITCEDAASIPRTLKYPWPAFGTGYGFLVDMVTDRRNRGLIANNRGSSENLPLTAV